MHIEGALKMSTYSPNDGKKTLVKYDQRNIKMSIAPDEEVAYPQVIENARSSTGKTITVRNPFG